jgi:hypothetical protein
MGGNDGHMLRYSFAGPRLTLQCGDGRHPRLFGVCLACLPVGRCSLGVFIIVRGKISWHNSDSALPGRKR